MSITTAPISNIEIAKAFAVLENAGVITDDASADMLSNWLAEQSLTIESYSETLDTTPTFPEVADPCNLSFTEEQLAQLHSLVERETRYAYDEVVAGINRATREFARCFVDLPLSCGTTLVEDTTEWEEFAEAIDTLVLLPNYEVNGFDATAFYRRRLEERQLNGN